MHCLSHRVRENAGVFVTHSGRVEKRRDRSRRRSIGEESTTESVNRLADEGVGGADIRGDEEFVALREGVIEVDFGWETVRVAKR